MILIKLIMIKENCGLFGVYGHTDAAQLVRLGLFALQHRGEESAGIVSSDGNESSHKNPAEAGSLVIL